MLPEPIKLTERVSIPWIRIPIKAVVFYMAVHLNLDTSIILFIAFVLAVTEILDYLAEKIAHQFPSYREKITLLIGLLNFVFSFILLHYSGLHLTDMYLLLYVIALAAILPTNIFGGFLIGTIGAFLYTSLTYADLDQFTVTFRAIIFIMVGIITGILAEANSRNNRIASAFKEQISHQVEASNLKNEFITIAYHTLRTPFTEIKGFHELLKNSTDKRTHTESIERMEFGLNKMESIIDNILKVVDFESNTIELTINKFNLASMINTIVDELQSLASDNQITIQVAIDPALEKTLVELDEKKIKSVIQNILDNAIRYSPENSIVTITCKESLGSISITIEDKGKGIAPEQLPYIFEKFHRIDVLTTDNSEGLGVGLYLANRIIQQHNGKITVESEPGTGTTFKIYLPKETSGAFINTF